jgi:hypothetical protein
MIVGENRSGLDHSKARPMGHGTGEVGKQEHGQSCLDMHGDMDDYSRSEKVFIS